MLIGGDDISNDVITLGTCFPDRTWIWKCCYLRREENRSSRIKTSRSKGENQKQPQPTYCVNAGTRTQTTVVGDGCSHHCVTFKNLLPCLPSLRSRRLEIFGWKKKQVSERETREGTCVSLARPALSRAQYFQAPATLATAYPDFVPFFFYRNFCSIWIKSPLHTQRKDLTCIINYKISLTNGCFI